MEDKKNISTAAPTNMAIVTSKLSFFVFQQVTKGSWRFHDFSNQVQLKKIFSALQAKLYQAYLIDIDVLDGSDAAIAEQLIQLKTATGAPIIIFASGYDMDTPLLETLRINGFDQFVTSDALSTMYEQLAACLEGTRNAVALAECHRREQAELEKTVAPGHRTIGFIGTIDSAGTTTQAMQYAKYLQQQNYTVCYIEAGLKNHVEKIPSIYEVDFLDKENGYLRYKGLDIYYKPLLVTPNMRLAYDVCVFDFGVLSAGNLSSFLSCTARVCVAGSHPWQIGYLRWALGLLGDREDVALLFPFASKEDKTRLQTDVTNKRISIFYPALEPAMFTLVKANKKLYLHLSEKIRLNKNQRSRTK